jgi:Flp pilus assembly protein TadD
MFLPSDRLFRLPFLLFFAICCSLCASRSLLLAAELPEATLPKLSEEARNAATRGLADFRIERFKDAKAEFQKMTELAPNHPMGWINLGSAEFRLGEAAEAEEHPKRGALDLRTRPG